MDAEQLGRNFKDGAIAKWDFYGLADQALRSGRASYQRLAAASGVSESVIRDRIRYLRQLQAQGR